VNPIGFCLSNILKDMIIENSASLARKWTYDRDRFLNSSEAGVCLRRLWFEKIGNTNKEAQHRIEKISGAAKRGVIIESYVKKYLDEINGGKRGNILFDDERGNLRINAANLLSGNPDFVYDGDIKDRESKVYIGEIKSLSQDRFKTVAAQGPFIAHLKQLTANMTLAKTTYPGYKLSKLRGLLLYVDCSDLDKILEFKTDELTYKDAFSKLYELEERAKRLFSAKTQDEIPAEGILNDDCDCSFCPFTQECHFPNRKGLEKQKVEMPQGLLDELVGASLNMKRAKSDLATAREKIIECFGRGNYGISESENGDYVAFYSKCERSGGVDVIKMMENGVSCADYMKPPITYDRVTLKKREENE